MRFLAYESCDFAVVRALRAVGEDVLAVSEFQRRSVDEHLMALALAENRILITEDKDFGWLAFAANKDSPGIILIRFPASARATLGSAIRQIVTDYGERLLHSFVVLQPGVVRINARPRGN